ncbi:restriction endonuclease subunit S [Nostoc sp. ChiQUE01b]|uniref:restriction endonuclease subunit S n=1 Tax=Nostoc sp. ChiQUE01b TaxID=3075376 RepID=UPI002AD3C5CA|nr:restriction endonuclease subunit S [Nostoc sp. ChiQUE01b]MDZ8258171.1 restriction endonuclease subunit S [Nostoc sp. ChiQUE01b]
MLKLTFKQTPAELILRAASTIIFNTLNQLDYPFLALSELAENPQYGFTASASIEEVGAKFVRITDLKDGGINWDTVPYCKCDEPEKYLIYPNDILFARTGATTGKTHLVKQAPYAVFASYLIRIRPKPLVEPEYLYSFFQSDAYWRQILDEKEGSAQPNVNGQKLINILVPMVDSKIQSAISKFLAVVRKRQDGSFEELPELPPPLNEQRRIVVLVEELVGKVEEVRSVRNEIIQDFHGVLLSAYHKLIEGAEYLPMKFVAPLQRRTVEIELSKNYPELGIRSFGKGTFHKPVLSGAEVGTKKIFRIEVNDLLFQIVFAWEGAVAVAQPEDHGYFGSHRFLTCIPQSGIATSSFLCFHFLTEKGLEDLGKASPGGAGRNRTLGLKGLENIQVPIPPFEKQLWFDNLKFKIDTMKRLREQAMKELDALLLSILDKAFKGEL